MPGVSVRSFCFGFMSAMLLSYVIVFHILHTDVGLQPTKVKIVPISTFLKAIDPPQSTKYISPYPKTIPPERVPAATAKPAPPRPESNIRFYGDNTKSSDPTIVDGEKHKPKEVVVGAVASTTPKTKQLRSEEITHIHWEEYISGKYQGHGIQFMSRNLVLGIAVNTNAKNFAIFAGSFRRFSPKGEAVIFMNSPVSDRHWKIAEEQTIRVVEFDPKHLHPEQLRSYHPSSIRWVLFHRFLYAHNKEVLNYFAKVIMVDVRDTMFQASPFSLIEGTSGQLMVFAEAPGVLIDSCGWNSGWIKSCFGNRALSDVRMQPILCSGISMGSMDKVSDYIGKMANTLLGKSGLEGQLFPQCERNGVDQGVHNYLVHSGQFKDVAVKYEHMFPVINVQAYPDLQVNPNDPSRLTNGMSEPYTIVHQYDRIHALQAALASKYVSWVDMSQPHQEWAVEPACADFEPVYDSDMFRGQCEFGSERTMSAASCCQACHFKTQGARDMKATQPPGSGSPVPGDYPEDVFCTSFTYANGACYFKKCRRGEVERALENKAEMGGQQGAVSAYLKLPKK